MVRKVKLKVKKNIVTFSKPTAQVVTKKKIFQFQQAKVNNKRVNGSGIVAEAAGSNINENSRVHQAVANNRSVGGKTTAKIARDRVRRKLT